jgi:hypothetical protein
VSAGIGCGGGVFGDVDGLESTLMLGGGRPSSSSSSITIGELRVPKPRTAMGVMRGALSGRRTKHAEFPLHNIRCRHHATGSYLLSLGMFCSSSPSSLNESDTRYNTIRKHIRNLSAFCCLVLDLPDKLLLDGFCARNLQSTHENDVNEECIQHASLV